MTGISGVALQDNLTFKLLEKANQSYESSYSGIKGFFSTVIVHCPKYGLIGAVGAVQTVALGALATFLTVVKYSTWLVTASLAGRTEVWKSNAKLAAGCYDKTCGALVETGIALTGVLYPNWAVATVKNAIAHVKKAPEACKEEADKALDKMVENGVEHLKKLATEKKDIVDPKEFEDFVKKEYVEGSKRKIAEYTTEFGSVTKTEKLYLSARSALRGIYAEVNKAAKEIYALPSFAAAFNAKRYNSEYEKAGKQVDKLIEGFADLTKQKVAQKSEALKKARESAEKAGEKPEDKAAKERQAEEEAYKKLAEAFNNDLTQELKGDKGLFKTHFLTKTVINDTKQEEISCTYEEVVAAGKDPKKAYESFSFAINAEVLAKFKARLDNDFVTPALKPIPMATAEPTTTVETKDVPEVSARSGGSGGWGNDLRRNMSSRCNGLTKLFSSIMQRMRGARVTSPGTL